MNRALRDAYRAELALAHGAAEAENFDAAFRYLERAHILGQRDTWAHVRTHWEMLRLGASIGDWCEVAGQGVRIVGSALLTPFWVPIGNTGRANVSSIQPMEIPEDLRRLIDGEAPGSGP